MLTCLLAGIGLCFELLPLWLFLLVWMIARKADARNFVSTRVKFALQKVVRSVLKKAS